MKGQLVKKLLGALSSKSSVDVAKGALPGAAINALIGGLTAGPMGAIGYGAGDFLLNYPLMRMARKISPGTKELVTNTATGKVTERFSPSALETGANITASLFSPLAVDLATGGALTPQATQIREEEEAAQLMAQQQQVMPVEQSQAQQIVQALLQRHRVNNMPMGGMSLAPNTMFQLQGIEQTAFHYPGVTLPPEMKELLA
jgi:hypothetical protein